MTTKPGVLLIGNFLSKTRGTTSVSERMRDQLSARGWQVVTASDRESRAARLIDILLTIGLRRAAYAVANVEVYSGLAFLWAEAAVWLLGVLKKPFVLTLHGGQLPDFIKGREARVARLLARAAIVTTPSQYVRESLLPLRADIRYLPNGIDLSRYAFRARAAAAPSLGWLRGFHAIYDPTLAVRVLGILAPRYPDLTLTLYGPDKGDGSRAAALSLASALGVADRLRAPGSVDPADVPATLARYDLYLNTTRAESFGVAVIEAAALGLIVITTDAGELPRLWRDGDDALIVPVGDAEAMAAAVARVLDDPALAERLSRAGRLNAERFDWATILPQWESLFHDLAARTAPSPKDAE